MDLLQYPLAVAVVVAFNLILLGLHIGAAIWARRVAARLRGQVGYELASAMAFLVTGVAVVRALGLTGLLTLLDTSFVTEILLIISFISQLLLTAIIIVTVIRIRRL